MAFPVTDLDAYERRMRWRARGLGFIWIWLGIALMTAGARSVDPRSVVVAVLVGSTCGIGLWFVRRPGTRFGRRIDLGPDLTRSLRSVRTWVIFVVAVGCVLASFALLRTVLDLFDVDLTFAAFGVGGWTAVGVAAILDAPRFGRVKRERYEMDLSEVGGLPSRPDAQPTRAPER